MLFADRRALAAAGARTEIERDLVAGDDSSPAPVERKIEEGGAAFDLACLVRQQGAAVLVEDERHEPRRHVIAVAPLALGHAGIELLHGVVLEVPVGRDVERLVDEFLVVRRQLRALEAAADVDAVVGVEVLGRVAHVADGLGHLVERVPQSRDVELLVAVLDERLGAGGHRLVERRLALAGGLLEVGQFPGQRGAVGDLLPEHDHLGQRADGDRRDRAGGSAPWPDRRRPPAAPGR